MTERLINSEIIRKEEHLLAINNSGIYYNYVSDIYTLVGLATDHDN